MKLPSQIGPYKIAEVLITAVIEKLHQKNLQKAIDCIAETTIKSIDSIQQDTKDIILNKINNVDKLTNSILATLEQNMDNLSPEEVLYFMDLIHKAHKSWNLCEEEVEAIKNRLNKI